ncbi:alpha/beta hydrolase [Nocardioides anomalus]|uniref:Alpha/beta hydrolase n=1 Tax=Nocardioides anomalus TaxID=2712223 RepID=A0A6G6WHT9_9ACTN|nr:alpha/beta hydrolase [Nocardioides anomalus]QIG44727.1 alpha/beta hydrolase [Nocardioides anomalus]
MTTPVEKSFTGVGGTNIVYDVYEPAAAPGGEPVGVALVAHGVAEHAGRYGHVAEVLVGLGLKVVVPDHRGHGRSGGKRLLVRDLSEYSADLETLRSLELLEGRPTYLLGHSMGGCIALDYALDHQDVLEALVLSAPAVLPGDDISPLLMRVAKVLGKVVPGLPGQKLSSASISRDPAVVAAYDADPLNYRGKLPAGVGGAMLRTMDTFPARLPSLRLPLLVLSGTGDTIVNPEGARLVDRLAGSSDKTLKEYDGLFHEVFNEPEKELVLGDLRDWVKVHLPAQ